MRAANADTALVKPRDRPEQLGALKGRHAARPCGDKLRVVRQEGRRVYHHLGVADILGALPHKNGDTQRLDALERITGIVVRPGKLIAFAVQDLGKRAHAAAADADEMDAPDFFEQGVDVLHRRTSQCIFFPYYIAKREKIKPPIGIYHNKIRVHIIYFRNR